MKDTNKYGFISGGYIFDLLDRKALEAINKKFPYTKDTQLYTSTGNIHYEKQLCDTKNIETKPLVYDFNDYYSVIIELWQHNTLIASATFLFEFAKHNYCETKGKR